VPQWHKWGPYVSERSWGTVREDYSENGDAWRYFPFDEAHKKTYRWGEDGIAGWCDRYQILVFSPVFWNGKDPLLKERLFGLSSPEGNHGEDVKECYYYLDGTPTHSYMKYLYKYPQAEFPYQHLKETNAARGSNEPEYELIDTGIFAENRYFDIFIEYAKAGPEDTCIKIEAFNRGDQAAPLHIIPQLWFRNQWAWKEERLEEPVITKDPREMCLIADDTKLLSPPPLRFDYHLGKRYLCGPKGASALFTDNESYFSEQPYRKDGFHQAIIQGEETVNPKEQGTKACLHYFFPEIPAHKSVVLHLRLADRLKPLEEIESIIAERKKEADAFYQTIHPPRATEDEKKIQRQAFAGMLWSKQIYLFNVHRWLEGDNPNAPPPGSRIHIRNQHWMHLHSMRILSMPDKWEYPWFAAWDLSLHCLTFALIDLEFAKDQLWLLLFDQFQHPNGEIPAYEWEFSDLNPPIQGWVAYRLYQLEKEKTGTGDRVFLEKCFFKLSLNFNFWVNKVDSSGCNVFEGGFLGLDNIALVDRSMKIEGSVLKQSDGTGWMATFCLNLMEISLELAAKDPAFEVMATKFFQHFVYIAHAMNQMGDKQYNLWNEKDGFFYDILLLPDNQFTQFRVRSLVGLIPLYATRVLDLENFNQIPQFKTNFEWFLQNKTALTEKCIIPLEGKEGSRYLLSLLTEDRLEKILRYVCDPKEFRSPYGLRSLSKFHENHPFYYKELEVGYEPGEAIHRIKGGNSNWRGPVWFPTNYLLIESLKIFASVFKTLKVKGSPSLEEMIRSLANQMISLFTLDASGKRPFLGPDFPFADDPHFRDYILFYEYYHGDTGKGLGASHQTGWTGLVANLIDEFRR